MKAIAKHDCTVTLYLNLNSISFNFRPINKGGSVEGEIFEDEKLNGIMKDVLGDRCVTFICDGFYIPTYSKDFKFVK